MKPANHHTKPTLNIARTPRPQRMLALQPIYRIHILRKLIQPMMPHSQQRPTIRNQQRIVAWLFHIRIIFPIASCIAPSRCDAHLRSRSHSLSPPRRTIPEIQIAPPPASTRIPIREHTLIITISRKPPTPSRQHNMIKRKREHTSRPARITRRDADIESIPKNIVTADYLPVPARTASTARASST